MKQPNVKVWPDRFEEHPRQQGEGLVEYCKRLAPIYNVEWSSVKNKYYLHNRKERDLEQYGTDKISTDKKQRDIDWEEYIGFINHGQELFGKAKLAQDVAHWSIKSDSPICVVVLGDLHIGSWATDHELFRTITYELLNTPNLYAILVGDLLQMAIKLRGVKEVMDNALPPNHQMIFLASWLDRVKHKVIASTWDNHSVMREENQVGFSNYSEIFGRHVIYHDCIGHLSTIINDIEYKWAVAHFFRGRSMFNPLHGHFRYIKEFAPDRDIVASGDSHTFGIGIWDIGNQEKVGLNCGSIQNSGYGKRFFSLINAPKFPCVVLDHKEKKITALQSVQQYVKYWLP